jgi:tRNA threonylcarbamoyladenosine biosynthesis protein TsaB
MITLALDTATAVGSLALFEDDRLLAERAFGRDELFLALRELPVSPAAVHQFAIGLGPGSFTGIRAGLAAVKGLALPRGQPILGLNSFDLLAATAAPHIPRDCPQLCVLADARRDEIYYALYDSNGHRQTDLRIAPLESIADEIHNPVWFVSPEIHKFADAIRLNFGGFATICPTPITPRAAAASNLLQRGATVTPLAPLYLRLPAYKAT